MKEGKCVATNNIMSAASHKKPFHYNSFRMISYSPDNLGSSLNSCLKNMPVTGKPIIKSHDCLFYKHKLRGTKCIMIPKDVKSALKSSLCAHKTR